MATPLGGEFVVPLPGRSLSKMPSPSRKKIVGVLIRVTLSNWDRPVSLPGAPGGRSPVSGLPATPAGTLRESSRLKGTGGASFRSEERRVGKEGNARRSAG